VSEHHYLPFGENLAGESQESRNTKEFTGHERDSATGMEYMLARYYSSGLGRFMSPDPSKLGVDRVNPQSWNSYTYALNSPITKFDPNGLYEQNFHEGTTYFLARQAGFSESEARTIAKANNDTDIGKTGPLKASPHTRKMWHGFEVDQRTAKDAARRADNLVGLGIALHHFQDTFSHEGYGAMFGHGWTTKPDKTSTNPGKAVDAALQSFEVLEEQAAKRGKDSFGAPDAGLLNALGEYDATVIKYNPSSGSLAVSASDAHGLANALKKQGYTVAIDGVLQ